MANIEYWGDSIAHGFRTTAKGTGNTRAGVAPKEILKNVQSKGKDYFNGKTIVLSSGYSNAPKDLAAVDKLVGELSSYGANVVLLGVSNSYNSQKQNGAAMNNDLASIASKYGAKFNGGFQASKDNVHPASYNLSQISGLDTKAGGKQTAQAEPTPTAQQPAYNPQVSVFGTQPTALLQGSTGLVVPETRKENELFSGIADMGLTGQQEAVYAEMAKGIAGASDSINSRPMIQSTNPLRVELSSLFDRINV